MSEFKFELGDKVKDVVTGYEGVVIAKTKFLNGCVRYGVQAQRLKDGAPVGEAWLDEAQLTKTGEIKSIEQRPTGGPRPAPRRQSDPKR